MLTDRGLDIGSLRKLEAMRATKGRIRTYEESAAMRVLCIGLTPRVLEMVSLALRLRWPDAQIVEAAEARRGLGLVKAADPVLVLLQSATDSDMPLMDTIGELRSFSEVPLMVWERVGGEAEAVEALELGADDYIRPPCGFIEVVARIVALLRRLRGEGHLAAAPVVSTGDLDINPTTFEAYLGGDRLQLTPTEFRLLYVLVKNRTSVVPHQFLAKLLWEDREDSGALLKKYIQRVRKKLGDDSNRPQWIANVRGVGYRYVGPSGEPSRQAAELTAALR